METTYGNFASPGHLVLHIFQQSQLWYNKRWIYHEADEDGKEIHILDPDTGTLIYWIQIHGHQVIHDVVEIDYTMWYEEDGQQIQVIKPKQKI